MAEVSVYMATGGRIRTGRGMAQMYASGIGNVIR